MECDKSGGPVKVLYNTWICRIGTCRSAGETKIYSLHGTEGHAATWHEGRGDVRLHRAHYREYNASYQILIGKVWKGNRVVGPVRGGILHREPLDDNGMGVITIHLIQANHISKIP